MNKFEQAFIKFLAYVFGVLIVASAIRMILHLYGIGFQERLF